MKKILLMITSFIFVAHAYAQKESLMPEKGDFGIEIGFNPFSEDYSTFKLINGIKARYFVTDEDAIRLCLGLEYFHHKDSDKTETENWNNIYRNGTFDFFLGYERHFNLNKRIDLYVGGQLGVEKVFARSYEGNVFFLNDQSTNVVEETTIGYDNFHDVGSAFGFGTSAFAGIDVYLWKGLYCGAELGLGVMYAKNNAVTTEKNDNGAITKTETTVEVSQLSAGFYCEPAIRLGWTF